MAENKGKDIVKMVVLLAVIVLAVVFIGRRAVPPGPPVFEVARACEECDHVFSHKQNPGDPLGNAECPVCGGLAVEVFFCYDADVDEIREFYRKKLPEGIDPVMAELGDWLYKAPGGRWGPELLSDVNPWPVPVRNPEAIRMVRYGADISEYRD